MDLSLWPPQLSVEIRYCSNALLGLFREMFRERRVSHEFGACLGVNFSQQISAGPVDMRYASDIHQ